MWIRCRSDVDPIPQDKSVIFAIKAIFHLFLWGSGKEHRSRTEAGIKLFISFFISLTADKKRGPARGLNADKS